MDDSEGDELALAGAQQAAAGSGDPVAAAVGHSFVCLGDGFATVPPLPPEHPGTAADT